MKIYVRMLAMLLAATLAFSMTPLDPVYATGDDVVVTGAEVASDSADSGMDEQQPDDASGGDVSGSDTGDGVADATDGEDVSGGDVSDSDTGDGVADETNGEDGQEAESQTDDAQAGEGGAESETEAATPSDATPEESGPSSDGSEEAVASVVVRFPAVTDGEAVFVFSYSVEYLSDAEGVEAVQDSGSFELTSGGSYSLEKLPEGTVYTLNLEALDGYEFEETSWSGTVGADGDIVIEPVVVAEPEAVVMEFSGAVDGMSVSAVVAQETGLSADAELQVYELEPDAAVVAEQTVRETLNLGETDVLYFMPYDVYFTDGGEKVEPESGLVELTMSFETAPFADEIAAAVDENGVPKKTELFVAHIRADGSVERIEPEWTSETEMKFSVTSFSVMGLALVVSEPADVNGVLDGEYTEIYVPMAPEGIENAVSAKTLEEAFEHLADGGTVWLTGDVAMDAVVLDGGNATVRSYGDAARVLSKDGSHENMFVLSGGASLTLENVVVDAAGNTNGRTIVVSGNSTLTLGEGSVLENNMSHGAVYLDGASLFVTGGTVRNNTATDGNGGAVLVTNGSVFDVTGGNFSGNSAQSGGAVYADVVSQLTVKNAAFENNTAAKADGGAICVESDDKVTMSLSETTFTGNTAVNYGGAVRFMAAEPELVVEGCTFTLNTSTDVGGRGGALWLGLTGNDVPADGTGLQASFSGCVFRGNKSTGYGAGKSSNPGIADGCGGGAVWCESGYSDEISDAVSFNDCQFDANTVAFGYSGAVDAEYIEGLSFIGCTMTGNTAPGWGGAVHVVNDSTNPSDILIDGGTFTENHTRTNGGVFNICCFAADITIRGDALFEHNIADQNAGAIYIGRSATRYPERAQECDVKVYMESCRILNNEGNGDLTVDKLVNGSSGDTARMQECERHYHAGAVYVGERCTLYMQDALITGNRIEDVSGDAFGNGITLCPNASAYFYPEHGAAVYDNGSSAGMDILAVPHDEYVHQEGLPRLYICDTTPDGQAYNWTNLNSEAARTGEYNWDNALSGISPMSVGDEYQGEATLDPIGFKAHVDGIMTMDLGSEPKVIISGNVARNLDNADTVYGSGGLMVNGNVLAGDFNITVEKKVEFLDDVSQEEQAEILDKEFDFELWIINTAGSSSSLSKVKVTGMSSSVGPKPIETEIRGVPYVGTVLVCKFTLKADEKMTFNFSREDSSNPFAGIPLAFKLFELDTGGALRTKIKQDVIRGDEDYKNEKKIETLAFVCTNTFGEPDTGELDIAKTVEGSDKDRFWSFDVTVGKSVAEGTLSPGSNSVTFVNEKQGASPASEPLVMPMVLGNDGYDACLYINYKAVAHYDSISFQLRQNPAYPDGFFEPGFEMYIHLTADEPLNEHGWVNGVYDIPMDLFPSSGPTYYTDERNVVVYAPVGTHVDLSVITNMPELYDIKATSGSFDIVNTAAQYPDVFLSYTIRRLDVSQVESSLTVTNTVIGDADGQTFKYTLKVFSDAGYSHSYSFELGPGESRTFSLGSDILGDNAMYAGSHYTVTQEPVEGFDTRVSVDGTYSVELWEDGAPSHLTGNNGGIEFADGIGTVTFVNGKASVQLKHGQMLKIKGLEPNLDYNVTEREANSGGYTTEATGTTGKIPVDSAAVAAFRNVSLAVTLPQTGGPGPVPLFLFSLFSCVVGISMILLAGKHKRRVFRVGK